MKNTIVIVDDHLLIAQALRGIVNSFKDFNVLYECGNGAELIEKLKFENNIPHIILLDVSMPIMNGFETASWLKTNHPEILIMTLSMQDDEHSVIKMIKNGAHGYLLKNTHPADLEKALLQMIVDGCFYPDWASKIVVDNLGNDKKKNKNAFGLSDREIEFLQLVSTELSYKEISDHMCCSPRTVEGYRDRLCEKLDLKTRVGLAVFAMKNGF